MDMDKLRVKYVIKCELLKNARLRHQMGRYGIVEQVINVPVDVNNMVTTPTRQLDDGYSFNPSLLWSKNLALLVLWGLRNPKLFFYLEIKKTFLFSYINGNMFNKMKTLL
jgi:hypothetical protein